MLSSGDDAALLSITLDFYPQQKDLSHKGQCTIAVPQASSVCLTILSTECQPEPGTSHCFHLHVECSERLLFQHTRTSSQEEFAPNRPRGSG